VTGQGQPTTRGGLRVDGWRHALQQAGLPAEDHQIVAADWTSEGGEVAMVKLVKQYPQLDAVYACNDQMALGVLSYAYKHGIHVPDQLGVVGFDDIPEACCFIPPLTTARQPFEAFCRITVQTLAAMIDAKMTGKDYIIPDTKIVYPELIIRDSSIK